MRHLPLHSASCGADFCSNVRYKAGQKEVSILRKLMENDASDKKHLIRLLRTFEHRGHLCLVFENLR